MSRIRAAGSAWWHLCNMLCDDCDCSLCGAFILKLGEESVGFDDFVGSFDPAGSEACHTRCAVESWGSTSGVAVLNRVLNRAFARGDLPRGRYRQRAFTLLELLVVMVIIGLLASFVAPRYFDQVGKSEVKAARAQLDALDKALASYRLDTGHWPRTEQGLRGLVAAPGDEPKWAGPYLAKALPLDPWGRDYVYRQPGSQGHEYDLLSLGKDGQPGGLGLAADVSIWDVSR